MATVSSTSLLSRTRSGRLPSGKSGLSSHASHASHDVISTTTVTAPPSGPTSTSSSLFVPSSHIAVFITNLCLLDLDLRPDWPDISVRTFSTKDASSQGGQKRRIQSVEWALYHLFCYWDPDEARTKMQGYFPPTDQVQSVNLRAAFLRGLETAKKTGALGRDAILRKTMLDECRGERFEEILAVFSSAVIKRVVEQDGTDASAACRLALENRGYSADRTQLHALILAHKASLSRTLRHKEAARARYRDFAELLSLKERSIVRRRELARALEEDSSQPTVSDDVKLRLQRLVRNNWSGSEAWMDTLVYGDERSTRKDGLLSTPPDRAWRRVQAGRLGELEGKTDVGMLDQLDRRVAAQKERMHRWHEYSRHVLGRHQTDSRAAAATKEKVDRPTTKKTTGIDFGFDAHSDLHPTLGRPKERNEETVVPPTNDDYTDLLKGFHADLANVNKPRQGPSQLASFLDAKNAKKAKAGHTRKESRAVDSDDMESEISDIDEHPIVQQQEQQLQQLSAPPSEDAESPTRRRVLLNKKSMTFSVKSYHSTDDDGPSPPREFLPLKMQRAATIQNDQPLPPGVPSGLPPALPPAVRKLSGQFRDAASLPIRRRNQSPPIRAPLVTVPPPPPAPRTPSPDRSPPPPSPPSDEDGPFELVSTPQHSIILQPPQAADNDTGSANTSLVASPTQDLADQILASMSNASPSPVKRPRHTLSLAERTRMSMARASRGGAVATTRGRSVHDSDEEGGDIYNDENEFARTKSVNSGAPEEVQVQEETETADPPADKYEDLVTRTRKSMAGFEAARQKAQLDRRRSMRKSRQSSLGVGGGSAATSTATSRREAAANGGYGGGHFPAVDEGEGYEEEDTTMLAEELMSGGQDDAEAIFRSRPKIKMSPIPSPTRELEYD